MAGNALYPDKAIDGYGRNGGWILAASSTFLLVGIEILNDSGISAAIGKLSFRPLAASGKTTREIAAVDFE